MTINSKKRSIALLSVPLFSVSLFSMACGDAIEAPTEAPIDYPEVSLEALPGKADGAGPLCQHFVHQPSADITVLEVGTIGRAAPGSNTVPATFDVDVGACDVLAEAPYDGYDCQFYDDCRALDVDCSNELGHMTNAPFLGRAAFHNVIYTRKDVPHDAPSNDAGRSVERYHHEGFNCSVLEVITLSRADALPFARGLGFYYDREVNFFGTDELQPVGNVVLESGEAGVMHRFAGLTNCWSGSVSSSMSSVTEFKPFMLFEDGGACWLNWDKAPHNHRVTPRHRFFDRSSELIRQR